jgi:mannose-6-phosphate isomerase-like protein (cupin superfamily)
MHEKYAPGADTGPELISHEAEEAGVIIRGEIEITVDDEVRVLGPGAGYLFNSRLPHRFRNTGDQDCEIISACTPPSF